MKNLRRSVFGVAVFMGSAIALLPSCGGDTVIAVAGSATAASGAGGAGGESSSVGPGSGGASGQGGGATVGSGGAGGQGGSGLDCANLPAGPINPTVAISVLNGSEDLTFDGKGSIAAKQKDTVVLVDAASKTTDLAPLADTVYGLRYRANGDIVAALPMANKIVQITPAGVVSDYVTGLNSPNGVYPDEDGNVWVTQFGGTVSRINPDKSIDDIVTGVDANTANGIVFDKARSILFYTNYSAGNVRSTKIPPSGKPAVVATIQGAKLDGLVMDACGNIYAMNQGGSELYRIKLDAAGAAVGSPELIATFPKNVANAQFGSGPGFDPKTLYASGLPGTVYAVPLGVPGAPVPKAP